MQVRGAGARLLDVIAYMALGSMGIVFIGAFYRGIGLEEDGLLSGLTRGAFVGLIVARCLYIWTHYAPPKSEKERATTDSEKRLTGIEHRDRQ